VTLEDPLRRAVEGGAFPAQEDALRSLCHASRSVGASLPPAPEGIDGDRLLGFARLGILGT
jgi:hypothetical protein